MSQENQQSQLSYLDKQEEQDIVSELRKTRFDFLKIAKSLEDVDRRLEMYNKESKETFTDDIRTIIGLQSKALGDRLLEDFLSRNNLNIKLGKADEDVYREDQIRRYAEEMVKEVKVFYTIFQEEIEKLERFDNIVDTLQANINTLLAKLGKDSFPGGKETISEKPAEVKKVSTPLLFQAAVLVLLAGNLVLNALPVYLK